MVEVAAVGLMRGGARARMLEAAEVCLIRDGFAALSTRAVALAAGTQLSQIHYHFGSKQGLLLALLEHQNQKLLKRQSQMFGADVPLSARWSGSFSLGRRRCCYSAWICPSWTRSAR